MELSGKIKEIKKQEERGKFKIRNLILTTQEQYPQTIEIQFVQDKCGILDSYAAGDTVKVGINIRGREWVSPQTGVPMYFISIQGWKINKDGVNEIEVSDMPF
jgi:translation initiation factor IF-3